VTESSRRPESPLHRAIDLAQVALQAEPSGLLTDFDGTISGIVGDPTEARLIDGAADPLARLAERLATVAIITGRAAGDARRLVGVPGVLVVGNHGVEWLAPGAINPEPAPGAALVAARLEATLAGVPTTPGVVIERKGLSATVHYRNAAHPPSARDEILRAVERAALHDIEVREGRMSVELRPRGLGDKGGAARAIVERHALRGVVVMGDDLTDLDMFNAVAELRATGRIAAAIIGVGASDAEVHPGVVAAADAMLAGPDAASAFLSALAGMR